MQTLQEVQIKVICLFETKPFPQRYYMTVRDFGGGLLILYAALQIYLLVLYFEQPHNSVNGDINFEYLVKIVFA